MSAVLSANRPAPDFVECWADPLSAEESAMISAHLAYAVWWDCLSLEEQGRLPRQMARECFVAGYLSQPRAPGQSAEGGAA